MRNKLTVRFLVLVMIVMVVLSACSNVANDKDNNVASNSENTGDSDQPVDSGVGGPAVDGDTLVVAAVDIPNTIDPEFDVQDQVGVASVHSTLVEYKYVDAEGGYRTVDTSYAVEPMLAEKFEASADGLTYSFTLRKGVKSKDGNELTTEDIKYTWERQFAVKSMGLVNSSLWGMTDINQLRIIDEYQFEITIAQPIPYVLQDMAIGHLAILDSKTVKANSTTKDPWGTKYVATNNAGFGPYYVEEMKPGQQMILVSNPDWYEGEPAIKKIIYKSVPDSANRLQLLLTGDVDVALGLSLQQLEEVRKHEELKVVDVLPSNLWVNMYLNNGIAPFDNVKVRQAISYAVPYDEIMSTVYYGKASPGRGPLSDFSPDYDPSAWAYDTDLDRAKALLKEAGFEQGIETTLYVNSGEPETLEIAVLVQSELKKIGVNISIEKVPSGVFGEGKNAKKWPMLIDKNYSIVDTAAFNLPLFWGEGSLLNWADWGKSGYGDYPFWEQVQSVLHSNDPETQAKVWKEAQANVISEASAVFIAYPGYHLGMKKELEGFTWHPDNHLRFRFFEW